MNETLWTAVDDYICDVLVPADAALDAALRANEAAGLPSISVTPPQGRLLQVLARMTGARRMLEIGTLGGYSAIWLARALPAGGRLVTLEVDPAHAAVALSNIARAGLADRVDLRLGRAIETLPGLDGAEPFDFFFIDADKESCADYFEWALKLSRSGSVIVVDNVVRDGAVVDAASTDPRVRGVRRLNERMAAEPRVVATVIQTVGAKGYDGFALARVT